jgi:hypothetical protein
LEIRTERDRWGGMELREGRPKKDGKIKGKEKEDK